MAKEFNQVAYQNEYNKQKYDRVSLMLPKGKKQELKELATKQGMSLNEYINHILIEFAK